jgi:hypothetical protein
MFLWEKTSLKYDFYKFEHYIRPEMSTSELTVAIKKCYNYVNPGLIKKYVQAYQELFYGLPITGEKFRASDVPADYLRMVWRLLEGKQPVYNGYRFNYDRIFRWAVEIFKNRSYQVFSSKEHIVLSMYLYFVHNKIEVPDLNHSQIKFLVDNKLSLLANRQKGNFDDELLLNIIRAIELINQENDKLRKHEKIDVIFPPYSNLFNLRGVKGITVMTFGPENNKSQAITLIEPKDIAYYLIAAFYYKNDYETDLAIKQRAFQLAASVKGSNMSLKEYYDLLPTLVELM